LPQFGADRVQRGPGADVANLFFDLRSAAKLQQRLAPGRASVRARLLFLVFEHSLVRANLFVEILFEREGRRRTEYLVERGRRAADRIRATGLYAQLSADRRGWGDRIGKILVSLGPAMYRDTSWSFEVLASNPLRWRIEMHVPASFPDLCRHSTQGFIDYLTKIHSDSTIVTSERSSPTLIVFRGEPR